MMDNTESSTSTEAADDAFPEFLSLFEPTEENVCEFGDTILVADDGFHPPSKIRISSCILASSSKPFKALFSKKFSEGFVADMRNAAAPHEVQIQDPPKPLSHLCRLLHHKPVVQDLARRLNGDLSTSEMLDLAVIADKYDCVEALRLPTYALLEQHVVPITLAEPNRLHRLTAAAYILYQPKLFRHFTHDLVLREKIQAKNFDARSMEVLPPHLIPSLFNQQNLARQELAVQITELIRRFTEEAEKADQRSRTFTLLEDLTRLELWPCNFIHHSLEDLITRFKQVEIPVTSLNTSKEQFKACGDHCSYRDNWGGGWGDEAVSVVGSPAPSERHRRAACRRVKSHYETIHLNPPDHRSVKRRADAVREMCVGVCLFCLRGRKCVQPHRHRWEDATEALFDQGEGETVVPSFEKYHPIPYPGYWEDMR